MRISGDIGIWLPSPLGDAIMATPALRAIRKKYTDAKIYFIATETVKKFLEPCEYCDQWITVSGSDVIGNCLKLRNFNIDTVVLFKNSFSCAMSAMLARIPKRIGYARDGRSAMLTEKLYPEKGPDGTFKPGPMISYYLAIAETLGCEIDDRKMTLSVEPGLAKTLAAKMPWAFAPSSPLVIIVPGGAFGPSKLWQNDRYAKVADHLIENHSAKVVVSVAPNDAEIKAANEICSAARNKVYSLADTPLKPAELKAMFAEADLVIGNDTGPRHIAVALGKKVVTLFGPNNWNWTLLDYDDEIKIRVESIECAPCDKPQCSKPEHYCMNAITVDMVIEAAEELLSRTDKVKNGPE